MVKILFLAANPSDSTRLRLDKEIREINEKLRQAELRDMFEIESHWAVRVRDLQGLILRHKPNIVHFSGHGSSVSEIILEDNLGNSHAISARSLSQLFSILKDDIQCVVLNACYSEQQAQTIAEYIDYVIGMSKAITDSAAISFAFSFYQALGFGQDIVTAFKLGCIQIDLENLDEQDTPQLIENKRLKKSVQQTNQENEDFFYITQSLREEDSQLSNSAAQIRNQHWDRFQELVDSLDGNSKEFIQKSNTQHYLGKYGLSVRQLKQQLKDLDVYNGEVNNKFTNDLTDAITDFQRRHNLRHIDGVFGPLTYLAMEEAIKSKRKNND